MAADNKVSLLRKYGAKLLNNGWSILPIPTGRKGPVMKGWESVKADTTRIETWAREYKNGNIGFHTAHTPAVDLDIYDEELSNVMRKHVETIIGPTLVRIGQAPKQLLVYRTSTPFKKRKTVFIDKDGHEHGLEVLGDGQQFVGLGIHPDTKKPYRWIIKGQNPVEIETFELPEITLDHIDELMEVFATECKRRGWTLKKTAAPAARIAGDEGDESDNDNALLAFKPRLDNLSLEQVREVMAWVPGNDDYDQWLRVGMALHHQFDGEQDGLDEWHTWSETASNYDADALEAKWASFHDEVGRNLTTFATLIKQAKESKREHAAEQFDKILQKVGECNSDVELIGTLATRWGRMLETEFQVDLLTSAIINRVKEISNRKVRTDTVRKAINDGFKAGGFDYKDIPFWCENVVYVNADEKFYSIDKRLALSERAFNGTNDRWLLTKKDRANMDAAPEQHASQLALNVYQIPVVAGYVYLPGCERTVEWEGKPHVNLFQESDITPLPEGRLSADAKAAVEAVNRHFEVSYPVQRERELLLSWLSYTLCRMDKKVRWAAVVQGVDGAGKGFIGEMMMAIMGKSNVITVSAQSLEEKYTSFFENRKLLVLEEARISGTSRYAVMDKLKPFVTNDVIDIRRMHRDTYNVPSVVNIMVLTNHADALPIYEADRRYFVVSTYFQTKTMIEKFRLENPDHFEDIYNAISYHPGAIRDWLEHYPIHPEFNADGHAPDTDAKARMMALARSEESDDLDELMFGGKDPDVTPLLLNTAKLRELGGEYGVEVPYGQKLNNFLTAKGFVFVGRARNEDGKYCRYWSKTPDEIHRFPSLQNFLHAYIEFRDL